MVSSQAMRDVYHSSLFIPGINTTDIVLFSSIETFFFGSTG